MIDTCEKCGREYRIVWRAPDDLWDEVAGEHRFLCPLCFDDLAYAQGKRLHWGCSADHYPLDTELLALETVTITAGELIRRLRVCAEHLEIACES